MIRRFRHIDWLSPTVVYPLVYLFYYLAGYIQWERLRMFQYRPEVPWILLAGLAAFLLGCVVSRYLQKGSGLQDARPHHVFPEFVLQRSSLPFGLSLERLAALLIVAGLVGVGLIVGEQGILLWDESLRLSINAKFKFLSSAFWFGMLILAYAWAARSGRLRVSLLLIYTAIAVILLIAYRTPVAILLLATVYLLHYGFRHMRYWQLILFAVSVLLLMVALDEWRTPASTGGPSLTANQQSLSGAEIRLAEVRAQGGGTQEEAGLPEDGDEREAAGEEAAAKEGLGRPQDAADTPWQRLLIAASTPSMSGQVAVSKIFDYTRLEAPLYGQLHLNIFTTVLPGQPGPRAIVTDIVNQVSDKVVTSEGRTTTPTVVGQLLLDFGIAGVVVGLFLLGSILTWMHRRFMRRQDVLSLLLYGYAMSISLIAIHTGLLDLVLYLFLALLLLLAATSDRHARKEEMHK